MSEKYEEKNRTGYSRMGLFMALGLTLDNLVIFSGGGIMVGLAMGLALEKRQQT